MATGAGITDDVVDVLTAKLGDGTVSADSTGLVSGKTLHDEVRVEEAEERHREEMEAQAEFSKSFTQIVDNDDEDF